MPEFINGVYNGKRCILHIFSASFIYTRKVVLRNLRNSFLEFAGFVHSSSFLGYPSDLLSVKKEKSCRAKCSQVRK